MFDKNLTLLTVNILENSEGHCLFERRSLNTLTNCGILL